MYQCSLFEVEQELLQTLPKSGTIVNGKLSEQTKWELGTEERESGLWLTPSTVQIEPTKERREKRIKFRKSIGRKDLPGSLAEQVATKKFIPIMWRTPDANMERGKRSYENMKNRQRDAIKSERSTQCDRERVAKKTKDVSNTNNSRYMDRQTQEQPTEGRLNALCESESSGTHERDVSEKNILNTSGNRGIQEQFYSKAERKEKRSLSREYNRTNSTRRNTKKPRGYWNSEPNVGRVANGIPNRVDRLRGLGNAIVPQVAYEIMKRIK